MLVIVGLDWPPDLPCLGPSLPRPALSACVLRHRLLCLPPSLDARQIIVLSLSYSRWRGTCHAIGSVLSKEDILYTFLSQLIKLYFILNFFIYRNYYLYFSISTIRFLLSTLFF